MKKTKKILLNHYTIFYILWIFFLVLWKLPRLYIGFPLSYSVGKYFLSVSNLILMILLPIYSIILVVKDILKKRYLIAVVNLIIITILVFVWLYLRRLGIEKME